MRKGNGAKLSEKIADGHHLIAMRAWSARAKPFSENAALVTTLLTQEPRITLRALVHDGRLWETASKAELEFIGWSPTEAETALAAGVRAVDFAGLYWELAPAHDAHALLVGRRAIVTQRSFPRVVVGVGAWTRR